MQARPGTLECGWCNKDSKKPHCRRFAVGLASGNGGACGSHHLELCSNGNTNRESHPRVPTRLNVRPHCAALSHTRNQNLEPDPAVGLP